MCFPRPCPYSANYYYRKHVLSDLKPYVCTFQSCELNMFDSQYDWFTHELQFHRKQWRCPCCKKRASESRPDLIKHLETEHQNELSGHSIDAFVETCRIERIDATGCPLCEDYGAKFQKINRSSKCDVSLKQFQQHLGSHMQQLALAALPPGNIEDEAEDDQDADDDEVNEIGESDTIREVRRNLLITKTGPTSCIICTDDFSATLKPPMWISVSCLHKPSVCCGCLAMWIKSDLESKIWNQLTCPECKTLLAYEDIQRLADPETFAKYVISIIPI